MTQAVANGAPASTVAAVANEFLALGRAEPSVPKIDQMKLQKLLFYAHAWYLAMNNRKPLFEDDFEAWPWGPVVRPVYTQTVDCGRREVDTLISEFGSVGDGFSFVTPDGVPEELKPFIRSVWDIHKKYTGVQLSNATHAPGEPWTIIKEQYGSLDSKPKIPNDLIAAVFEQKLKQNAAANTAA
ncbi:hypothetical protein ASE00_09905 [Sphingomonas sp. Root710]|uniref:Panacea domain-containing protein n=1 Tax=Sphingomonas sp. Root710 TaxID=1736594 RepID=UPI0006F953E0|nr:type II toxin-antitoxin system antitoxin SocA domain-containing protein [Sphingomonas sp. Root710]KRB82372.1 hypothetical protein ASE00_09905 [Sphingomonas sp. Root710]